MAEGKVGRNLTFPIFNSDGTPFNDLVLHKATYDSVVMSLGDKISGDVYYRGTDLAVTMGEYVEYEGVKFVLVSPPVIVREGMVSDNSELKGLTKYSFTFYHPMYMLANFPFSDVAVSNDQKKYLSENKSFSWIGNLTDFVAKINKNLDNTQWYCDISLDVQTEDREKLSEVLPFDNASIADALKKGYETWKFPYIIDSIKSTDTRYSTQYAQGKRFLIQFGLPTRQIVKNNSTFIFEYGQGVGLKNNSRTPRNNKIITRIAGYGSEDNIPYGYPQIQWYGNQSWDYTVNNNPSAANSYPIYDGIVGGQKVRLIKHPFTRTHLMPTIYATTLFNKISPYLANGNANPNYNPTLELVDYYDADNTYPNPIVANSPSYEIHEFEDIKPELQSRQISSVGTYDGKYKESVTMDDFLDLLDDFITQSQYDKEKEQLEDIKNGIGSHDSDSGSVTPPVSAVDARLYSCKWSYYKDDYYAYVKYESNGQNFEYIVRLSDAMPTPDWDDTMDDEGNYVQSYFTLTLPALGFDLYACAAITQEMSINMRSGACLGCTFPVMVDWDDYKKNFYDDEGNFDPVIGTGHPRDAQKYPNSTSAAITVVVQKDLNTFGTLMPNIYQKPAANDDFVILGISLPQSYVTNAQTRLEQDMKQYMRDNNVHYYDYPLKFDEYFLANNTDILQQMRPNVVVKFKYNDTTLALYIKQFTVKFGDKPLPEYNITLTDDVEIVLNDIGKVSEEVSNLRILMGEGGGGGGLNDNRYLRKDKDDTAAGLIRLIKGLQVGEQFVSGLLGEGGIFRKDADGTTYLECDKMYVRMKAYFDTVEVRRFIHSGGNRIASAAGIKCSRVEWLTSGGVVTDNINNVEKFRCYFRANDDGKQITNDFEANDLAYCKETNINVSQSLSQRFYWRKVVGVSSSVNADGEHYIDLSKSDCLSDSDYPLAQDDIIQLGNTTDTKRQGAIVEYVSGEDAPSYQIYQGINTYNLERKNYVSLGYKSDTGRAYMNVYGDFYFGDRPASGHTEGNSFIRYNQETGELDVKANVDFTHPESTYGTENLDDFIAAITQNIGDIQDQVDGNIESWFYDYMPVAESGGAPVNQTPLVWLDQQHTIPCLPYKTWYDTDVTAGNNNERIKHLGDTFYDNSTGYAFRFSNTGTEQSPVFAWVEITDSAVIKALADAAKAQDTADHKRRAFVLPVTIGGVTYNYPYPPYDVGDLWLNAKYPYNYDGVTDAENNKYNNDVLRCITSQDANGSFSISHWVLASKYTDDTVVNDFIENTYQPFVQDIQGQVDKKAETWYQDDNPESTWYRPSTEPPIDKRAEHVGDIWCDTSANGGKKTKIYKDFGTSANPRYAWAEQAVPDAVFDTIDGKCAIYVSWNGWIDENNVNNLQVKDLLIPQVNISQTIGGVTYNYKKDKVYRCTDASTPVFREIEYTDDTTVNNIISRYGNILGITPTAGNVGEALGYLREVLGGNTTVDGGLILSHLIALKNGNQIMAGMNGTLQNNSLATPAAWYGGAMVDYETLTDAQIAQGWNTHHWAMSLFRFNGSGYLAQGNITWDAQGKLTIKDIHTIVDGHDTTYDVGTTLNYATTLYSLFHTSTYSNVVYINPQNAFDHIDLVHTHGSGYQISDSSVLNYGEMKSRFVPLEFFNALFTAYHDNTAINPWTWTDTASAQRAVINNLKVLVGTWTESYLSALGLNSSGGGGSGVQLAEPLSTINAAGMGAPNTTGQAIVWNGSAWVYSIYTTLHAAGLYSAGTIASYGNFTSTQGNFIAASGHGFKVSDKDNTYVLLAGGGTSNLKTINGNSIMGSGDIVVSSGSVTSIVIGNSTPYEPTDGTVILPAYPDEKKAGTYQSSNFLYLIGSESSSSTNANATAATKTNPNCYISSNCLYSNGSKVLTVGTYTLDNVADGTTRKLSDYTKTANLGSMAFADTGDYALAADTVFKVKVGTTEYTPSSGTVSLPAYPTKTSQLTNDSGFITGYTNTWRGVYTGGTSRVGTGTGTKAINFKAGSNISVSYEAAGTGSGQSGSADYFNVVLAFSGTIPTKTSQLTNTSGFISGITSGMVTDALGYTPANATALDNYLAKSGGTMTGTPFIKMPASAASIDDSQPFGITYGKIQCYGTLTIAADTDGSQTEYVNITAGYGMSNATAANGLSVGYSTLKWKGSDIATQTWVTNQHYISGYTDTTYTFSTGDSNGQIKVTPSSGSAYNVSVKGLGSRAYDSTAYLPLAGGTMTGDLIIGTGCNLGIGTTSPDAILHVAGTSIISRLLVNSSDITTGHQLLVNGTTYLSGNTSITGNLGVGKNADSDYRLDVIGQLRFRYSENDTQKVVMGLFADTKNAFIRFTDANGSISNALRLYSVTNSSTGVTSYVLQSGDYDRQTRIIGSNVRIYSRTDASATTYTPAIITMYGGRVNVGNSTSTASTFTDCQLVVDGYTYTSRLVLGTNTYLEKDANDTIVNVQGGMKVVGVGMVGTRLLINTTDTTIGHRLYVNSGTSYLGGNTTINGDLSVSGTVTMCSSKLTISTGTVTYSGNTFNVLKFQTAQSYGFYLNGTPCFSYASWITTSDIRQKNVIRNVGASIDQIAKAPIFDFKFKDRMQNLEMLGSSAQYWQQVFPNAIKEVNGTLAMDYSATALAAAVITARKVQNHEDRILELERENEALRREIDQLKLKNAA